MTAKFTVMEYILNVLKQYTFEQLGVPVRNCLDPDYDTYFPLK